jgi:hypothetical protein
MCSRQGAGVEWFGEVPNAHCVNSNTDSSSSTQPGRNKKHHRPATASRVKRSARDVAAALGMSGQVVLFTTHTNYMFTPHTMYHIASHNIT